VIEGDAAVACDPGGGVGEGGGDVVFEALGGDATFDGGGEEVGGGDADFGAEDVVLGWNS